MQTQLTAPPKSPDQKLSRYLTLVVFSSTADPSGVSWDTPFDLKNALCWVCPYSDEEFHQLFVEGREKGGPRGALVNKQKAEVRRNVIVALARQLLERARRLNMSEMAIEIEKMKHKELKRGAFDFLGAEAIRKHLRTARKAGWL